VVEIGVGSGFILDAIVKGRRPDLAVGTDVDITSLLVARERLSDFAELVQCDCANSFRDDVFQLAYFNPPYLPGRIEDDPKVYGGEDGSSIAMRMLSSAVRILLPNGLVYFVISSQTGLKQILKYAKTLGEVDLVKVTRLFFESIAVYRLRVR
jgi:methylase of polypeptide subunit release factors